MQKKQEELFISISEIPKPLHIASYLQNDLSSVVKDGHLSLEELNSMQIDQSNEFDVLINKLTVLKKECFEFFKEFLPKSYTEEIRSMLISYWFLKNYTFVTDHVNIDYEFIENHDFYVHVTEKSARNGYDYDTKKVLTTLKLNEKYKIRSMSVSQSSSSIELSEFPGTNFNSVNFEFLTEYTEKVTTVSSYTHYE